jgi:tryptophan-rich hypothetical protein
MRVLKIRQSIKTEFLRKSKKIPEVTCQIRLGRYHTRPIGLTLIRRCGSLAQLVEQLAFNQLVAGSNPARPTIFSLLPIFLGCPLSSLRSRHFGVRVNQINPAKLLHSKWTAVRPENKEKHFLVVDVEFNEEGVVISCLLEAVINKRTRDIDWRDLKISDDWKPGWK